MVIHESRLYISSEARSGKTDFCQQTTTFHDSIRRRRTSGRSLATQRRFNAGSRCGPRAALCTMADERVCGSHQQAGRRALAGQQAGKGVATGSRLRGSSRSARASDEAIGRGFEARDSCQQRPGHGGENGGGGGGGRTQNQRRQAERQAGGALATSVSLGGTARKINSSEQAQRAQRARTGGGGGRGRGRRRRRGGGRR